MTEKERWLVKDLEAWHRGALEAIGRYGPKRVAKEPATVSAARRASAKAAKVIRDWEAAKRRPWEQQKAALGKRYETVKRVILFENTEAALKAIEALKVK